MRAARMPEVTTPFGDLVKADGGRAVTTSIDVAERFEKEHFHVLRSIREIEVPEEFSASNFGFTDYEDSQGKSRPMCIMTRDGFTLLAMGFTGPKAMAWKVRYIEAFNAMEAQIRKSVRDAALSNASWRIRKMEEKIDRLTRDVGRLAALSRPESPEALFVRQLCELGGNRFTEKAILHAAYCEWCARCGHRPAGSGEFFKRLYALHPVIRDGGRLVSGGKRARIVTGIGLKEVTA